MTKILNVLLVVIFLTLLVYVLPSNSDFPNPPEGSLQSTEPGDMEGALRRAYYTNLSREEVISHYITEFNKDRNIYTLRLNYPPEEAQTIVRDQTKSTYLEELTHPLRESLFINGLESDKSIYEFRINEVLYKQKITIKYVPSSVFIRVLIVALSSLSGYWLVKEYLNVKRS